VLTIALAVIAGSIVWQRMYSTTESVSEPLDADTSAGNMDSGRAEAEADEPNDEIAAERGAPGSMQAGLFNTTEGNRHQILALTIAAGNYPCPLVKSAKAVGRQGLVWRVHCGDALVYWVEVDEFDRLSVTPVPYADFNFGNAPVERATPDSPLNNR
jgi:hypothetical protein